MDVPLRHPVLEARAPTPAADRWYADKRLIGLSRFAVAITVLNIVGHLYLGFEQSWATPFVAVACAYVTELIGETCDAWADRRRPRFAGSFGALVRFLLPAHISGLAVGMLLYAGDNLAAVAFASSLAIASKYVFRLEVGRDASGATIRRHFLNPSNFGIAVTLVLFPLIGIAPPYQFAENTFGWADWVLPAIIISSGGFMNIKVAGRMPLILGWLAGFAAQALLRAAVQGSPWNAGLEPMTGVAFLLFTAYMMTDPATTPSGTREQVAFGAMVAATYGVLMELHIVFGLFFALAIVAVARAIYCVLELRLRPAPAAVPQKAASRPG